MRRRAQELHENVYWLRRGVIEFTDLAEAAVIPGGVNAQTPAASEARAGLLISRCNVVQGDIQGPQATCPALNEFRLLAAAPPPLSEMP